MQRRFMFPFLVLLMFLQCLTGENIAILFIKKIPSWNVARLLKPHTLIVIVIMFGSRPNDPTFFIALALITLYKYLIHPVSFMLSVCLSIILFHRESPVTLWPIVPVIVLYLLYGMLVPTPHRKLLWEWPCPRGQLLDAKPLLVSPCPFRLMLVSIH